MAKNILIVDDAAFMRMMIKDILSKNGYTVAAEAENGKVAVDKYNEAKPDLVLMDITMPEMDGIQALKAIKANDPNAQVIMCSAMGQQAMVIEAIHMKKVANRLPFLTSFYKFRITFGTYDGNLAFSSGNSDLLSASWTFIDMICLFLGKIIF